MTARKELAAYAAIVMQRQTNRAAALRAAIEYVQLPHYKGDITIPDITKLADQFVGYIEGEPRDTVH